MGGTGQRRLSCPHCHFVNMWPSCPFLFLSFNIFSLVLCPSLMFPLCLRFQQHYCDRPRTCGTSSTLSQTWFSFQFGQPTASQGVRVLDGIRNGFAICMAPYQDKLAEQCPDNSNSTVTALYFNYMTKSYQKTQKQVIATVCLFAVNCLFSVCCWRLTIKQTCLINIVV